MVERIPNNGGSVMKAYMALLMLVVSGGVMAADAVADKPADNEPGKTSYVQCCIAPGGDGSSDHPFSSVGEAEADLTWATLMVLPSKVDSDKLSSDMIKQQRNPDGSLNTTRAVQVKVGKLLSVKTPSGRTMIVAEGQNDINNCVCPATPAGAP
jgi:hypothetical protein